MKFRDIPEAWKKEIESNPDSEFSKRAILVRDRLYQENTDMLNYVKSRQTSTIGDRLSEKFTNRIGAIPCGNCKKEIASLNQMTPEQVYAQIDQIIERIENNSKTASMPWYVKLVAKADTMVTGGKASRQVIRMWIEESINDELNDSNK